MPYLVLFAYWLIFWRKFLINPYLLCTSEVASTFFPHWLWVGRQLRKGIFPAQDEIYYKLPASIPFLATFYPPNLISAYIGSFLKEDRAFRLYAYFILFHFLICSVFAYQLFGNLFAAITLAYAGYVIKPNTPTFVYTVTWVPLAFCGGIMVAVGWSMALLGGYYPVLVYVMPLICLLQPLSFVIGSLMSVSQLIPFLGYFKRSVRMTEKVDRNFGRVPFLKLFDLINPIRNIGTTNGVHYPEMMMYMGIAPFFIWKASWWWLGVLIAVLICSGLLPSVQRIPARALYLLTFSIASLVSHAPDILVGLQGFLLIGNSSIYPSFPFSQWWEKPSRLYTKKKKSYKWPFLTGYREERKISDYIGAFRIAD